MIRIHWQISSLYEQSSNHGVLSIYHLNFKKHPKVMWIKALQISDS